MKFIARLKFDYYISIKTLKFKFFYRYIIFTIFVGIIPSFSTYSYMQAKVVFLFSQENLAVLGIIAAPCGLLGMLFFACFFKNWEIRTC